MMPKIPNYAKFFSVYLRQEVAEGHTGEALLNCPLSECPNPDRHFFADCDTGQWHCKRCDESGNALTLITKLHEQYLHTTTDDQYKFLAKRRGISASIFRSAGFAYNDDHDFWYVPFYTYKPEQQDFSPFLNNLGYFYPSAIDPKSQFVIHKAPTLPTYLYNPGIHQYAPVSSRSIVCEGEWDTLAYYHLHPDTIDLVLGKPGAGFPIAYLDTISETTETIFILDNDDAGRKQQARAIGVCLEKEPKRKLFVFDWSLVDVDKWKHTDGKPTKDIRDFLTHKNKKDAVNDISEAIVPYDVEELPADATEEVKLSAGYVKDASIFPEIRSFGAYIEETRKLLLLGDTTVNAMGAVLGITTAISIPGEPLWGFLRGPASCLAGDTVCTINRAGKSFKITMKDLYHRFHGGIAGGKVWRTDIPTTVQYRHKDGSIRSIRINDVMYSGIKQLYTLTTESGKMIRASANHKFLTTKGWKRLKNLRVGDYVYSNQGRKSNTVRTQTAINSVCGLRYHPHAQQKDSRIVSEGYRIPIHRLTVEASLNRLSLEDFKWHLRYSAEASAQFTYLCPRSQHVHHKDENRRNNDISNLEVMDATEHKRMHALNKYNANVLEQTLPDRITSIVEDSIEDVYDLAVDHPHNFLADGIVVHNSGKTTHIESYGGDHQWFDNLSRLSAETLISGWVDENPDSASYLGKLSGKTLFVKDFTPNLTGPIDARIKLFGLLTDIYDGQTKIVFGNRRQEEYHNINFNMVCGVTDIIDSHSAASIGERFLRIDWLGTDHIPRDYLRKAFSTFGNRTNNKQRLTELTLGFVKYLRSKEIIPGIEPQYEEPLLDLADFVATLRTKVESNRFEGLVYRPRPELPIRIGMQLAKLFLACRVVTGTSESAFKITRKVALDTCYGFPLDVVKFILQHPHSTREEISQGIVVHSQRAYRVLSDLTTTGVLKSETKRSTRTNGRPIHYFSINPRLLPALQPEKYLDIETTAQQYDRYQKELDISHEQFTTEDRSTKRRSRPANPPNSVRTKRSSPPKRSRS